MRDLRSPAPPKPCRLGVRHAAAELVAPPPPASPNPAKEWILSRRCLGGNQLRRLPLISSPLLPPPQSAAHSPRIRAVSSLSSLATPAGRRSDRCLSPSLLPPALVTGAAVFLRRPCNHEAPLAATGQADPVRRSPPPQDTVHHEPEASQARQIQDPITSRTLHRASESLAASGSPREPSRQAVLLGTTRGDPPTASSSSGWLHLLAVAHLALAEPPSLSQL